MDEIDDKAQQPTVNSVCIRNIRQEFCQLKIYTKTTFGE